MLETALDNDMARPRGKKKSSIEVALSPYTMAALQTLADHVGKSLSELSRDILEIGLPIYLRDRVNPIEEFQSHQGQKEISRKVSRKLDLSIERLQKGEKEGEEN